MTRRGALKLSAATGMALFFQKFTQAQADVPVSGEVSASLLVAIGNNHGHAFVLSVPSAISLLRATRSAGPATFNIQGTSSHPHAIELTHEDMKVLFLDGEITKRSSLDFNHSHPVTLKLDLAPAVVPTDV